MSADQLHSAHWMNNRVAVQQAVLLLLCFHENSATCCWSTMSPARWTHGASNVHKYTRLVSKCWAVKHLRRWRKLDNSSTNLWSRLCKQVQPEVSIICLKNLNSATGRFILSSVSLSYQWKLVCEIKANFIHLCCIRRHGYFYCGRRRNSSGIWFHPG